MTVDEWAAHPDNEHPEQVAERFDLPVQWAMMHVGDHRCVDGRRYIASCLVSDPDMEASARSWMDRVAS